MKDEELENLRREYKHLVDLRDELIKVRSRIKELEQEPIVREYLSLLNRERSDLSSNYKLFRKTDEELLEEAIRETVHRPDCSIYIYIGDYKTLEGEPRSTKLVPTFIPISKNEEYPEYRKYRNIECNCEEGTMIFIDECEEFEQRNIVLYPPNKTYSIEYFNKIRRIYFDTAIKYGKEKAVEKILYKKNMQKHSEIGIL